MKRNSLPIEPDPIGKAESISSQVKQLLQESYAIQLQLREKTLDEIGSLLESNNEKLGERAAVSDGDNETGLRESFARVKELYCSILMQLDSTTAQSYYYDWKPEALLESDTLIMMSSSDTISQTVELERPPQDQTALPVLEDWTPASEPLLSTELVVEEAVSAPLRAPAEAVQVSEQPFFFEPSSAAVDGFVQMATYLQNTFASSPQAPDAKRLAGMALCFALEAQAMERIANNLSRFWEQREWGLELLLEGGEPNLQFSPDMDLALTELADRYQEILYYFPKDEVLSFLRLLSSTKGESVRFTLLEFAILLLFFGQEEFYGVKLTNILGTSGVPSEEFLELCCRLIRVHRIKTKLLDVSEKLGGELMGHLEEDLGRVLQLLGRLSIEVYSSSGNDETVVAAPIHSAYWK